MGRAPIFSEAVLLKAQLRRQDRTDVQRQDRTDVPQVPESQNDSQKYLRSIPEEVEPLEQRLADVIQRIYPLPAAMERSPTAPKKVTVLVPEHRKVDRRSNLERERLQGDHFEARLALLRKDREWDPQAFLRKNSIDLVKGASATGIERALGGKFVFESKASTRRGRRPKAHPLLDFRKRLLSKWPTIQEAFAAIDSYLSKVTRPMNLQEWANTLSNLGLANLQDARVIYELLDENKDGEITLQEFHWGIETVAPVTCLESLRKRLLCVGFPSMCLALSVMHGGREDTSMHPLTFEKFSACLCRVYVIQPKEHRAIFDALRDPNDTTCTVTLSELLCGLAAVSPPLVLEELALLFLRHGGIDKALAAIQEAVGSDDDMSKEQLQRTLSKLFGFTPAETAKLLPMVDVDGVEGVSVAELKSALLFAEPALSCEGSRKKVQQGYRSIHAYLHNFASESEFNLNSQFRREELEHLLESVEGVEAAEMSPVVAFVSRASSVTGMSIDGFLKALRLFAPCCVLEDLRMQLWSSGVGSAFQKVPNRRVPLDRKSFAETLLKVGAQLSDEGIAAVFELLDIRCSGVVTISELIALMQCSQPKSRMWREPQELELQVALQVRQDFAPILGSLQELKQGIRIAREVKSVEPPEPESTGEGAHGLSSSASMPDLRSTREPVFARRTFQRITSTLSRIPDEDGKITEIKEEIGGYFAKHQRYVGDQQQLLLQPVPSKANDYNLALELRRRAGVGA